MVASGQPPTTTTTTTTDQDHHNCSPHNGGGGAGVAVDDQGYICVADSGNNRIQIFHPDGSFLRAFGSWGSGDAEFKGLEGEPRTKDPGITSTSRDRREAAGCRCSGLKPQMCIRIAASAYRKSASASSTFAYIPSLYPYNTPVYPPFHYNFASVHVISSSSSSSSSRQTTLYHQELAK
ncbi:hypothetical protein AND_003323 [Anopheles darlingi]|uniref:Uncharacterized protein n=1 Tax=Anopheles darlingi TaxID=43151 RepID=W5JKP0_ANODA|nr:hypothetical protein AND_003323 [Anopheles darlingi]